MIEKLTAVSIVRRGVFVVRELFDIRMRSDDTFGQNLVPGYLRSAEDLAFEPMPLIDHDAHGRRRLIDGNHGAAAHFESTGGVETPSCGRISSC